MGVLVHHSSRCYVIIEAPSKKTGLNDWLLLPR